MFLVFESIRLQQDYVRDFKRDCFIAILGIYGEVSSLSEGEKIVVEEHSVTPFCGYAFVAELGLYSVGFFLFDLPLPLLWDHFPQ